MNANFGILPPLEGKKIKDKKQKRTGELFNTEYTKELKEEIKLRQEEKNDIMEKYKAKEEEINKIYNSKKWKYIEKMSQLLRKKKVRRNLTRQHKKYKIGKNKEGVRDNEGKQETINYCTSI